MVDIGRNHGLGYQEAAKVNLAWRILCAILKRVEPNHATRPKSMHMSKIQDQCKVLVG